jgi:hypothetical protein
MRGCLPAHEELPPDLSSDVLSMPLPSKHPPSPPQPPSPPSRPAPCPRPLLCNSCSGDAALRERLKQLGLSPSSRSRISSLVIIEVMQRSLLTLVLHRRLLTLALAGGAAPAGSQHAGGGREQESARVLQRKVGVAAGGGQGCAAGGRLVGGEVEHAQAAGAGGAEEGVETAGVASVNRTPRTRPPAPHIQHALRHDEGVAAAARVREAAARRVERHAVDVDRLAGRGAAAAARLAALPLLQRASVAYCFVSGFQPREGVCVAALVRVSLQRAVR